MSDIINNSTLLRAGDVVQVSKKLINRHDGQPYWWKTFRVVIGKPRTAHTAELLILKMNPDLDKDLRTIDFNEAGLVVQHLPENSWPQGVIAMRMKHIMQGLIKLGED